MSVTEFVESWFVPFFFLGMAVAAVGSVLMVAYKKPNISSAQLLFTGTDEEPYPLLLKPRLEMVRDDKRGLVYGMLFAGIAIVMLDVLALAGFAIARSMGAI